MIAKTIFENVFNKLTQKQKDFLLAKHKHIESGIKYYNSIYLDACGILKIKSVLKRTQGKPTRESVLRKARFAPYKHEQFLLTWRFLTDEEKKNVMIEHDPESSMDDFCSQIWSNIKQLSFSVINQKN